MPEFVHINWNEECIMHVAEHDVTPDEFEQVLRRNFEDREPSHTDPGNWIIQGLTDKRRFLVIVFQWIEEIDWINPITAYEPDEEL